MASDWVKTTLGEIVKLGNGIIQTGPFGSQLHASDYVDEGIPVIMPLNIINNKIDLSGIARITKEDAERLSKHLVKKNDIVYSRRGDVTRKALITELEEGMFCGTGCLLVRPGNSIDARFLTYHLSSPINQEWIIRHAVGATMPNLNTGILKRVPLNIPSLDTQKAIAHILGSLDDKIELNRQMNETLEAMAQALFKSWFVDFDPVIDNALAAGNAIPDEFFERAEQRKGIEKKDNSDIQGLFPDEFEFTEEMGWIPKGWAVGSLDNMFELQRGFDLPKTKRTDGIYPLMAASGQDGTHDEYKVKGPGVITGRSGKLGIVSFTNANYWPLNTTLWVKNYKQSNPYHAYFFLQTLDLEKYNSGSAVPSLNRNNVHNLIQILPSNIVLDKFQEVIESSFAKIAENNTGIETLAKLRDTLLPKLMSGELRIPDTL